MCRFSNSSFDAISDLRQLIFVRQHTQNLLGQAYRSSKIMGTFAKSLITATLVFTLCNGPAQATDHSSEWPETVVSIKDVRPVEPIRINIQGNITKGKISGPVVIRLHINSDGEVVKARLMKTCGNADLDEIALHATRHTKFSPYEEAGTSKEVTLILPISIPKKYGRS